MKSNRFYRGAAVLSLGGLLSKAIGALYRIPLTNLIGTEGLGLYQLVFPIYALLLGLSTAGIPAAVSAVTASIRKERGDASAWSVFRAALTLGIGVGLPLGVLPALFSRQLASWVGNPALAKAFCVISPAVVFVCVIAGCRGYLQGLGKMTPTAISQLIEQVVKAAISLPFAWYFSDRPIVAVTFMVGAITVSELMAAVFLLIAARRAGRKRYAEGG